MKEHGRIVRRKLDTFRKTVSEVAAEYSSSSTIHGVAYLGADDKSLTEKIWWLIVFILSLTACGYLIADTWLKWQENPVILSFSQRQSSIWEIPFPAVTICPINKVKKSVYNYTHALLNYQTLTGKKLEQFWDVSLICDVKYDVVIDTNVNSSDYFFCNILQSAPTLDETFLYKFWGGVELIPDIELFTSVYTEEGLCFTFNNLGQSDMFRDTVVKHFHYTGHDKKSTGWSIEGGYTTNDYKNSYPDRASQNGVHSGLNLRLRSFVNEREYRCGTPASGFKVILHNPADMPPVSQQYILVPVNKQKAISVTPEMITTAESLLNISPHVRNCYFSHEKRLHYFKVYTPKNCKIECFANLTNFMCNCLPFYFPKESNTKICGFGDVPCFSIIKKIIFFFERKSDLYRQFKDREEYRIFQRCNCLPSCTTLEYSAETSQNDLYWAQSRLNADTEFINSSNKGLEVTQLDIFFKDTHFLSRHRSELFGQTDFLANCGGLLGLFMGISLFSLLEIVYYLTIRIWCRLKKKETKIMHVMT